MTERLHFHFSLSCIGEGNGNPLQCSCLENPRDGRAWWAVVHGVAQSQTRLKCLSSSSSSHMSTNSCTSGLSFASQSQVSEKLQGGKRKVERLRIGPSLYSHKAHLLIRAKSLQSCPTLCNPVDCSLQAPLSKGLSRQEYWSGLPEACSEPTITIEADARHGVQRICSDPHNTHPRGLL